jgi:hypothetical protein
LSSAGGRIFQAAEKRSGGKRDGVNFAEPIRCGGLFFGRLRLLLSQRPIPQKRRSAAFFAALRRFFIAVFL